MARAAGEGVGQVYRGADTKVTAQLLESVKEKDGVTKQGLVVETD